MKSNQDTKKTPEIGVRAQPRLAALRLLASVCAALMMTDYSAPIRPFADMIFNVFTEIQLHAAPAIRDDPQRTVYPDAVIQMGGSCRSLASRSRRFSGCNAHLIPISV